MRIEIGQVMNYSKPPAIAIEIEGVGIFKAQVPRDGFPYIELSKKQMIQLKEELEKSINEKI
jgi:hypothetical protein